MLSDALRLKATAFIRNRKLDAGKLVTLIISRMYQALQLCLDHYYERLDQEPVSKQAFSQARRNLDPEFIRGFVDTTAEIAAKDYTLATYQGRRLIAIDGSDIALENAPELIREFGCSGSKRSAATALCSIAYGPLDHVIYDCRLDKYATDERDLAKAHIERLTELNLKGSLLLFDRGYPSAEFIAFIKENGYDFVMRVRRKFNLAVDAMKTQGMVTLEHDGKHYPVRVLKVTLPTGEVETLLTSLNQKQLPIRHAADLYFKRWGVETAYDLIKDKLQLENFSGKTKISVLQDFYATIYLGNLVAFAAGIADEQISLDDQGKDLKYPRQANRNRTISKLRDRFLDLLLEPDENLRATMLERLFESVARRPVSIVKGRSPARKSPRNKKFHNAKKTVV